MYQGVGILPASQQTQSSPPLEDILRYASAMTCDALHQEMHCISAQQALLIAAAISGVKPAGVTTATFTAWVAKVKACRLFEIPACADVAPALRALSPVPACLNASQYSGQTYCKSHAHYIWSGNRALNAVCWLASLDASYQHDWLTAPPCAGVVPTPTPSPTSPAPTPPAPPSATAPTAPPTPPSEIAPAPIAPGPTTEEVTSTTFMSPTDTTEAGMMTYGPPATSKHKQTWIALGVVGAVAVGGLLFFAAKKKRAHV